MGLGRTTPADSLRGGAEMGTVGGGHMGLRQPDVHPPRRMPVVPPHVGPRVLLRLYGSVVGRGDRRGGTGDRRWNCITVTKVAKESLVSGSFGEKQVGASDEMLEGMRRWP